MSLTACGFSMFNHLKLKIMIYFKNFKNAKEFNELFGIVEHGNGAKSRRNKILLEVLKNKEFHKWWKQYGHLYRYYDVDLMTVSSMNGLKKLALAIMRDCFSDEIMLNGYAMHSLKYKLDAYQGLCEDGDGRSVRYINTERGDRVFKMKAGKFITNVLAESYPTNIFPEQLVRWLGEEFARDWQSYATGKINSNRYTLHVDDDFASIYNCGDIPCYGDFKSCMAGERQYKFYSDSISAEAAYLTDSENDGNIVARCIIYTDVHCDDKSYRLAERQYATDGSDLLKQILVDKLIAAGEIDGYKKVGVDCHANDAFISNSGEDWSDKDFWIYNTIASGDTLSYQDSFVYLNMDNQKAYNKSYHDYSYELSTTDSSLECGHYSEWYDQYIPEDESTYDEYYEDYCYSNNTEVVIYNGRRLDINASRAEEDCDLKWSECESCYVQEDECCYCEDIDDYVLVDEAVYSEYDECSYLATNCVETTDEGYCPKDDCFYDEEEGEWYRNYGEVNGEYVPSEFIAVCDHCGERYDTRTAFHSDVIDCDYCCEKCVPEAEKEFRECHALAVISA